MTPDLRTRLFDQISVGGFDTCWEWKGGVTYKGYGHISIAGRQKRVHRVIYEWLRHAIPEGHQLHHTCKNRRCVNPRHLAVVTASSHVAADGFVAREGVRRRWREATHCKSGHLYTPETTLPTRSGGRRCAICARLDRARYNEKRRARRAAERAAA